MQHNPVTMVLWHYYLFRVSFTVCISFKFYLELSIEYKILNDHEIHNWIACSSTIELEGLIQTKFHLDKGQKYLLQEYDKEETLFLDVDDINEVEDRARLKVIVTSDKDTVNDEDRNSCLPQKMGVNNDIAIESSASNETGFDNGDEMDVR